MPKICYEPKRFSADNLRIVELSEQICMAYAAKESSWELDALDPETITELVKTHVESSIVDSIWGQMLERERADRKRIADIAARMRTKD